MPRLNQLTCTLDWSPADLPLQEYAVTYWDRYAESWVAVPDRGPDMCFSIRLQSHGYIASGLAMFVYMDGVYQCNRNRVGLIEPVEGVSKPRQTEVDFRVRQKEEWSREGGLEGRSWRFGRVGVGENNVNAPLGGEYVGTIEVVVLRCVAAEPDVEAAKLSDATSRAEPDEPLRLGALFDGASDPKPKHGMQGFFSLDARSETTSSSTTSHGHRKRRRKHRPERIEIHNSNVQIYSQDHQDDKGERRQSRRRVHQSSSPAATTKPRHKYDTRGTPSPIITPQQRSERSFSFDNASTVISDRSSPRAVIARRTTERSDPRSLSPESPSEAGHVRLRGGGPDKPWDPNTNPSLERDTWGNIITKSDGGGSGGNGASWDAGGNIAHASDWETQKNSDQGKEPAWDNPGTSSGDQKWNTTNDAATGESKDNGSGTDGWNNGTGNAQGDDWDTSKDPSKSSGDWNNHTSGNWETNKNNDWNQSNDWSNGNGPSASWDANDGDAKDQSSPSAYDHEETNQWGDNGINNDNWGNQGKADEPAASTWDDTKTQTGGKSQDWNNGNQSGWNQGSVDASANNGWSNSNNQAGSGWPSDNGDIAQSNQHEKKDDRASHAPGKNGKPAASTSGEVQLGAIDPSREAQQKRTSISPKQRNSSTGPSRGRSTSQKAPAGQHDESAAMKAFRQFNIGQSEQDPPAPPKQAASPTTTMPGRWSPPMQPSQNGPSSQLIEPLASTSQAATPNTAPTIGDATSPAPRGPSKAYWSGWRKVNEFQASQAPSPAAPNAEESPGMYTLPQQLATQKSITHQVHSVRPAPYRHKVNAPQYVDTHEDPYAVFVFQYREKAAVERIVGHPIEGLKPEEEETRLWGLTKAELVEEVKRLRMGIQGSSTEATPTAWTAQQTPPVKAQVVGPVNGTTQSSSDWGRNPKGAGAWVKPPASPSGVTKVEGNGPQGEWNNHENGGGGSDNGNSGGGGGWNNDNASSNGNGNGNGNGSNGRKDGGWNNDSGGGSGGGGWDDGIKYSGGGDNGKRKDEW